MASVIATVQSVRATVYAINANGERRVLKAGDQVLLGERIVTTDGAELVLKGESGSLTTIGGDRTVLLNDALNLSGEAIAADEAAMQPATPEAQRLITALNEGRDLSTELEAPAAGAAAGGGHSFVRLLRISETANGGTGDDVGVAGGNKTSAEDGGNNFLLENTAPVANDDVQTLAEDAGVTVINVLGNDFDPNNDPVTVTAATASSGTVVINPDGTLGYTPAPNFNGSVTITYTIDDGRGGTDTATVTLTVTPVNDAPVGPDQNISTPEDTPISGAVTATDVDGDNLTFVLNGGPANGTVVVNADGTYTYTPNANYNGNDSFTVTVSDGNGGTDTIVVNITVTPVNDAPVGPDQNISTPEDTPISGAVTATDVDGDNLTFVLNGGPANGTVIVNADGSYTYTPNANYNGNDQFTVTVSDGNGGTDTIVVNITVTPVNDAPVGADQNISTPEDTPTSGAVVATDVDGDNLNYTLNGGPANGSVVVNADGTYTYTPGANYNGNDSFTVTVSDGNGGTDTITVNITVTPVNDAPVGADQNISTPEDTPISGAVVATDVDGDNLNYTLNGGPANGTVVVNADGSYTYTPDANYNGNDSFTVTVFDGNGGTDTITVNINVTPVNVAPVGPDQNISTDENTPVNGAIIATDADGDTLSYALSGSPANGTVIVNADGSYTYTPATNYNGNDSFIVTVSDGNGGTDTITVNISVAPVNVAPVGPDQNITTDENTPVNGAIIATDADGDTLSYVLSGSPANGTVILNTVTGTYTYTPNSGYSGSDSFVVTVSDGNGGTDTITVNVGINNGNDAPVANNDTATTDESTAVTIAVRGNDTDADGDALTVTGVTQGANGSVVIDAVTGNPIYTPNSGFSGTDSFTYTVSDGNGGTASATVTVTVNAAVNTAPVGPDTNETVAEDGVLNSSVSATDADGDALTYTLGTGPAHGALTFNPDGTYSYTPGANYNGSDSFTVTVSDGRGGTDTITVNINVTPQNDAPTAADDAFTTNEDVPVTITLASLIANDSDVDGDSVTVFAAGSATNGTLSLVDGNLVFTPNAGYSGPASFTYFIHDGHGGVDSATVHITVNALNDAPVGPDTNETVAEDGVLNSSVTATDQDGDALTYTLTTGPAHGALVFNADGTYSYTPSANYNGSDSFVVTVSDGNGGTDTITVNINVTPVNDLPVAADDFFVTNENTPVTITLASLIANDSDADGDSVTVFAAGGATNGTLGLVDGNLVFTPNAGYSGPASFTYSIHDGHGGVDTATVHVNVLPVNEAPVGPDTNETVPEDGSLASSVAATDADGDALTYAVTTGAAHGTLNFNADGTYIYTPDANYNGPDSFVVTVSDGKGGTDTITVNINVTPQNDAPVTSDQSLTTPEETSISGTVVATDIDGDTLTYTISGGVSHGSLLLNTINGNFTYTPNANYTGPDSFTITIYDGKGGSTTSTITVNVTPVNDAPVGPDRNESVAEDGVLTSAVSATDADGDALTYAVTSGVAHGTLNFNADGTYSYTPDANYNGPDSFVVTVSDGKGGTDTITVNINVTPQNDAPVTSDQSLTTPEDTSISGTVIATDIDGDTLTYTIGGGAAHGSLLLNTINGNFTYTPNANYTGPDSFVITIYDGKGGSTSATITVNVTPVNDAPVGVDRNETVAEDGVLTSSVSATDVNGDALSYALDGAPAHGSVTVNPDGTYTYTPTANYNGNDSFTVTVSDGKGGTDTITVNITVTPVNDAPTAANQSHTIAEDGVLNAAIVSSDIEGDSLSYALGSGPAHGSVTVNADGTYSYTPTGNWSGSDSFTVTVSDGNGGSSNVTVDVNVSPVADAPALNVVNNGRVTLFTTSWEGLADQDTYSDSQAVSGPTFDGWRLVTSGDTFAGGANAFEIWQNGDGMRAADGSKPNVYAGEGNGNAWLELNNGTSGSVPQTLGIERTVSTEAGAAYQLSFDYAGRVGFNTNYTAISIYVGGVLIGSYAGTSGNDALDWTNLNFSFTGTGGDMTIRIVATPSQVDPSGRGAMIDDIRLSSVQGVIQGNAHGGAHTLVDLDNYVSGSLGDTDGSETLSFTFGNLPAGALIITADHPAGIVPVAGSVTLTAAQLASAQLQLDGSYTGTLNLNVTATSTETANGHSSSTSSNLQLTVLPDNDDPSAPLPFAQPFGAGKVTADDAPFAGDNGLGLLAGDEGIAMQFAQDAGGELRLYRPAHAESLSADQLLSPDHLELGSALDSLQSDATAGAGKVLHPAAQLPQLEDKGLAHDLGGNLADQSLLQQLIQNGQMKLDNEP